MMTRPSHRKTRTANCRTWQKAMQWVATNQNLVRHIARPYLRFMRAESNDLLQEATIAAFTALNSARARKRPEQFIRFFRVIFKTNCIKLAKGIPLAQEQAGQEQLPNPEGHIEPEERDFRVIAEALKKVTRRERQACLWILRQQRTASAIDLARAFKVSRRQACRLLSRSIGKISGVAP